MSSNWNSCTKPINLEDKSFFLAEAGEPEEDKTRRLTAINTALGTTYKVRSALDEKGINAFTCKICEMIQGCAYGIVDITGNNPNVLFELGLIIALGKPTIILIKKDQEQGLLLPSDLNAIEVVPFTEYIDIIDQLKEIVNKLPPPTPLSSPIQDLEKIRPQLANELRNMGVNIVKEFKETIEEAKLDTIFLGEEKKHVPPKLDERLRRLEEKLEDMTRLGFATDAETALSKAIYFYNRGKYEDALASYNWTLELRPDNPVTLYNRGITYAKLERYNKALADFNRSLELKPDAPNTIFNRGTTYAKLERYDDAFDDLNRALELKPDHSRSLYNLACLLSLQEKTDDALANLEKVIIKDKKYQEDAKTDKDFDNIKEDPRFKKLIEPD
ncbi:tetratricopeptide repeat protein [Chloroflexota bacterium]